MMTYKFKSRSILIYGLIILCGMVTLISCKKYLEAKPQLSLTTISSLQDLQALLNNSNNMNSADPAMSFDCTDDFYVSYTTWQAQPVTDQQLYTWNSNVNYP